MRGESEAYEFYELACGPGGRGRGEAIVEPDGDAAHGRAARAKEYSAEMAIIRPNIDAITLPRGMPRERDAYNVTPTT